jgi:glycosyltransferase involved in cell wall biosynthesis
MIVKGRFPEGADKSMGISIVIPSYQRSEFLHDTLSDLSRQNFPGFELIVVLQTWPSAEDLEALPGRPRVFYINEPNASLARNVGLLEARYNLVLFLDDDVRIYDPTFLRKHARNFDDNSLAGVWGQVLELGQAPTIMPDLACIERSWGWVYLPANYDRRCRTRDGRSNNLAVRRAWAIAVGGMDAQFVKGARREETEFNLRYTAKYGALVFDPKASLTHLNAQGGGSRAWGHIRRIVPMHHIVGHWYFLFSALKQHHLSCRGVVLELRHLVTELVVNPQRGRRSDVLGHLINLWRAIFGAALAMKKLLSGPRRIDSVKPNSYKLILGDGGCNDVSAEGSCAAAMSDAHSSG